MQSEQDSERDEPSTSGDYGYDAAHEFHAAESKEPEHAPVQQATETSDEGQDYSYDLAHDVPR